MLSPHPPWVQPPARDTIAPAILPTRLAGGPSRRPAPSERPHGKTAQFLNSTVSFFAPVGGFLASTQKGGQTDSAQIPAATANQAKTNVQWSVANGEARGQDSRLNSQRPKVRKAPRLRRSIGRWIQIGMGRASRPAFERHYRPSRRRSPRKLSNSGIG